MGEKTILLIFISIILVTSVSLAINHPSFGYGGGGGGGGGGSGSTLDSRVCGDKLCSEIPGGREAWESRTNTKKVESELSNTEKVSSLSDSPRKQMDAGTAPEDVVCKSELALMIKSSGTAACVKESSIERLIEKGWVLQEKYPIIFITDKDIYKIGEPINITMKNIGVHNLQTPSVPVGFSIYDQNDQNVCFFGGLYLQIGNFPPDAELSHTWDPRNCGDRNKIYFGTFEIRADHFYSFSDNRMPKHQIEIFVPQKYLELKNSMDSKYVELFDNSVMVFTGNLTSKIGSDIPDAYILNFDVTNDLKHVDSQNVSVTSHEDIWINCIVEEGSDYLVFITPELLAPFKAPTNKCTFVIELPNSIADDVILLYSSLYE